MKLFSGILMLLFAQLAFAQQDLELPGEKWVGSFDKYICQAFAEEVDAPTVLKDLQVQFENITTDSSLDNALLRANFIDDGVECRYNAILFADNDAQTVELVQSIAFNKAGGASTYRDCAKGKAVLDQALQSNDYLYYGHPHNLAIMAPGLGANAVCGEGAEFIGINFVVSGKLK